MDTNQHEFEKREQVTLFLSWVGPRGGKGKLEQAIPRDSWFARAVRSNPRIAINALQGDRIPPGSRVTVCSVVEGGMPPPPPKGALNMEVKLYA